MQGHLKAIGVSNFGVGHLKKLATTAEVQPAVNQIELTPFLQRNKLVEYCNVQNILLEVQHSTPLTFEMLNLCD